MATKSFPKVIEVEKRIVPELDQASAAGVASLQTHPGFQYLLAKLAFQRSLMKDSLAKNRQKDIRDVEFLQSGINWCGWLEDQLVAATGKLNAPTPRIQRAHEREAFEQLLGQIDVVGMRSSADNRPEDERPQGER